MRLSRLLIDGNLDTGCSLELSPERAHYVRNVLRIKSGQPVVLFDGKTTRDFNARVQIDKKRVIASIESVTEKHNDPEFSVTVIQGIGRSEHNDWVVQKGCELGVSEFIFFNAQRTQSPVQGKRLEKRLTHWQAIARSACEQCDRNKLPDVRVAESLAHSLDEGARNSQQGLVLDFKGSKLAQIKNHLTADLPCSVLVGPEGGLTDGEIEWAQQQGLYSCRLGPRVLRMETAAISAVVLLQHHFADM